MSAPVLSGHQGAAGADPAGPVVKPHPERIARELVILTFGGVGRMRRMAEWPFNPTPQPLQSFHCKIFAIQFLIHEQQYQSFPVWDLL